MPARVRLFDRTLSVDASRGELRIERASWPALLVTPALAVTPASLAWVELGGGGEHLSAGGWAFLVLYGALALASVAFLLRPVESALGLPPALAAAVRDGALERVETEANATGTEPLVRAIMIALVLVAPGLMFAWAALT